MASISTKVNVKNKVSLYIILVTAMNIEYHNIYTHFVFTTYRRERVLFEDVRERIEKYITGIVNNNSCKLYAIYINPEHAHFLVSKAPNISEQRLAEVIAVSSENFINENKLVKLGTFSWQKTASAFSVSKSNIDKVCKYIFNQPEHHKTYSFKEEYEQFLKHYQKTIDIDKRS